MRCRIPGSLYRRFIPLPTIAVAAVLVMMLSVTLMPPALAHYLWIEQDAKGNARLYFGEFENALNEKSPGRLDEIRAPLSFKQRHGGLGASSSAATAPLASARTADGFMLAGRADAKHSLIATDASMAVKDWRASGVGIVKPVFYARYAASAAAFPAQMALDVTPDGSDGRFKVTLNGKPLAKSKVEIYAPNGWARDARTDDAGVVTFAMPWRGQYVLEATHKEETPGEYEGAKYEALRHRATLTIMQSRGTPTFTPATAKMKQMH